MIDLIFDCSSLVVDFGYFFLFHIYIYFFKNLLFARVFVSMFVCGLRFVALSYFSLAGVGWGWGAGGRRGGGGGGGEHSRSDF